MLSIVIPARNVADSIVALVDETLSILGDAVVEIIVVDDCSDDATADRIVAHTSPTVRLVRHDSPGGAAAAIHSGVLAARYPIVCVVDGDARVPPWHIPEMLAALDAGGPTIGLILARRQGRASGGFLRVLCMRVRQAILRDGTIDPACGMRLFRRDVYLSLPFFDNMQHYLASLFLRDGWQVGHVEVDYRGLGPSLPRHWSRPGIVATAFDILGVIWLRTRPKRGASMLAVGAAETRGAQDAGARGFRRRG